MLRVEVDFYICQICNSCRTIYREDSIAMLRRRIAFSPAWFIFITRNHWRDNYLSSSIIILLKFGPKSNKFYGVHCYQIKRTMVKNMPLSKSILKVFAWIKSCLKHQLIECIQFKLPSHRTKSETAKNISVKSETNFCLRSIQ